MQVQNPYQIIEERFNQQSEQLARLESRMDELIKSKTQSTSKKRITRAEFRDQYGVSFGTIHNLVKRGHIKRTKVGRKCLYDPEQIEEYFNSQKK